MSSLANCDLATQKRCALPTTVEGRLKRALTDLDLMRDRELASISERNSLHDDTVRLKQELRACQYMLGILKVEIP